MKTDGWTIQSAKTSGNSGRATVTIDVISAPTEYVEAKGKPPHTLEGGRGSYLLSLSAKRNTWVVTDLEGVAE